MRYEKRLAVMLATIAILAAPGWGQSGRHPQPQQPPSTTQGGAPGADVQLGTQEVLLSVTVRGPNNKPVAGLTQDDFIVAENRVRQKLTSCTVSTRPISVVLLLDASGSVFSEMRSIRTAAEQFVSVLGPDDQVSVIEFADKVELLQDWTTDRAAISHAIEWRLRAGNSTAFWDAIYLAADQQLAKIDGPSAIVILSDGDDTSSKLTEEQALGALDRAACSVFVVSKAEALIEQLRPYAGVGGVMSGSAPQARYLIQRYEASQEEMQKMADRYGGILIAPPDNDKVKYIEAFTEIASELKQQYVITYVPQNETRDGRWRSIDIYLTRPGLVAKTRKGYIAE
jgi:VWFA-related protein